MKKIILTIGLIAAKLIVLGQSNYINPGLSLVTCKNEIILKYKSKVLVTNKDKTTVNGEIVGYEENAIIVAAKSGKDVRIELKNIEKIKVKRIGEALACCGSLLIGPPIYYALTTKTFYFDCKDNNIKSKKKVINYKVKELQLDQIFYGKTSLCK